MNAPTPARCPTCGTVQASTVCSTCKTSKAPFSHHDDNDRVRVYQERDRTTHGGELRPGR